MSDSAKNTDIELWRETDSFYAPSIHVTAQGGIGINVGGHVFVKPLAEWHRLAVEEQKRLLANAKQADEENSA